MSAIFCRIYGIWIHSISNQCNTFNVPDISRNVIERKPTPIKTKDAFTDKTSGGVHEYHRLLQSKTRRILSRGTLDKLFLSARRKTDTGLIVSYEIAEIIDKSGLPDSIREKVIAPGINKVIAGMTNLDPTSIFKSIAFTKKYIKFMSDIFEKLNISVEKLQGKCADLILSKENIGAFISELTLQAKFGSKDICQFPHG
ncbi:hypothetical protein GJ496_000791 [Pomphorhynchus laevis]|nr:hypothetical protein GJ496_000791 [Pomphorhynchus laevis]